MNELLVAGGTLTPLSSKTHITYQLPIIGQLASLELEFRYSPKVLVDQEAAQSLIIEAIERYNEPSHAELQKQQWERYTPLQNLLTLSVDDPNGFRGSAHRHSPEQKYKIAGLASSPGFINGELPEGLWRITISVHCVITPECSYQLIIRGGSQLYEMDTV
ncbi:hypothetical protein [Paenibacillus sp. PL2-23]|uniref:hypothetical protein n=1 Tax=Paenibacillus sp. PL2-23 TaxID=2100729 RepID=UPI0030F972B3